MKRTHLSSNKQVLGEKWYYNGFIRFNDSIQENNYYTNPSDDGLFTWPPKNYTCSFCKREFNSAQALGGHMNVHRRDRARLRQLPSWIFECPNHSNPNFNPNPKFSLSSSSSSPCATNFLCHASFCKNSLGEKKPVDEFPTCHDLLSPRYGDLAKDKSKKAGENCELTRDLKNDEVISLDLEMMSKDPKQVLDLELRLGCLN